jgi:hypothetical protein
MSKTVLNSKQINSYAVLVIDHNKKEAPIKPIKKLGKKCKTEIHKIFTECSNNIDDPFWKDIFTKMSYGKFPLKFGYIDGKLFYKKSTKMIDVVLSQDDPIENTITTIVNFLHLHGSMFSKKDAKAPVDPVEVEELTWANASNGTRQVLIYNYVEFVKNGLNLTKAQEIQLMEMINYGLGKKCLTFEVYDRKIMSIGNLIYSDGYFSVINASSYKNPPATKTKEVSNIYEETYSTYIKNHLEKIEKFEKIEKSEKSQTKHIVSALETGFQEPSYLYSEHSTDNYTE